MYTGPSRSNFKSSTNSPSSASLRASSSTPNSAYGRGYRRPPSSLQYHSRSLSQPHGPVQLSPNMRGSAFSSPYDHSRPGLCAPGGKPLLFMANGDLKSYGSGSAPPYRSGGAPPYGPRKSGQPYATAATTYKSHTPKAVPLPNFPGSYRPASASPSLPVLHVASLSPFSSIAPPQTGSFVSSIVEILTLPFIQLEVRCPTPTDPNHSDKVHILLDSGSCVSWVPRTVAKIPDLPHPAAVGLDRLTYSYPDQTSIASPFPHVPSPARKTMTSSILTLGQVSIDGVMKPNPSLAAYGNHKSRHAKALFYTSYAIGSFAWGEIADAQIVFPDENGSHSSGKSHALLDRVGISKESNSFCGVFGLSFGNYYNLNTLFHLRWKGVIDCASYTIYMKPIFPQNQNDPRFPQPQIKFGGGPPVSHGHADPASRDSTAVPAMRLVNMGTMPHCVNLMVKLKMTKTSRGEDLHFSGNATIDTGTWFICAPDAVIRNFERVFGHACGETFPLHWADARSWGMGKRRSILSDPKAYVAFYFKTSTARSRQWFPVRVPVRLFLWDLGGGNYQLALKRWLGGIVLGTPFLKATVTYHNLENYVVGFLETGEVVEMLG